MDRQSEPPIDRFVIAAVVDRLIYDSETVFDPDDARVLLGALPRRRSPRFEFGIAGKFSGRSSRGYAAGIGSVKVNDGTPRNFRYSTARDAYTRVGQWKLLWSQTRRAQFVEIEQVMAEPTTEGRGARIHYSPDGEPTAMDIRTARAFKLLFSAVILVFPGWKAWKTPGSRTDAPRTASLLGTPWG
jgi:hypothetical protein